MVEQSFGLPRDLGDGLLLRWATPDDIENLAEFNVRELSDDPDEPEEYIRNWTYDLMRGEHPTTSASDFTVVFDENDGGKIVSSLCLISQTWAYDGIQFGSGRPELVATATDYRRRGLIREQMNAVHAKSEARDELVQAITGIPWFYRQFGYEMALNLAGGRAFRWDRRGNHKPVEQEPYSLRPATVEDIPVLARLYPLSCADSLIMRIRDDALWHYEMTGAHQETGDFREFQMIETADGRVIGYFEYKKWRQRFYVREFGVTPGHSWRTVSLFVTRVLRTRADELNKNGAKPTNEIFFQLGDSHPVYQALGTQLERREKPYAWYVRMPDIRAFLRLIAPAMEKRLADSVIAGHTGSLRLNLYRDHVLLAFEGGRLTDVGAYAPKSLAGGDATFPDLSFLQLLLGYRSLEELDRSFADCGTDNAEAAILLNVLFPKRASNVVQLG
jgi:hypothetical protein